ncbi:hypothetical protein AVEN_168356-1 [Araneus ventricosus]|uniref:Uncharacterized protein n=1 Tax=Araneus ventricosus TaxID=182803 RepID=A0A4Y2D747_ARAVE|nr:hypothetical protein AVEN_168356-1 [Araneus ventricosus]
MNIYTRGHVMKREFHHVTEGIKGHQPKSSAHFVTTTLPANISSFGSDITDKFFNFSPERDASSTARFLKAFLYNLATAIYDTTNTYIVLRE